MLLQLVTHLLAAAETDDSCPIPAVFALSAYRDCLLYTSRCV